VDAGFYRSNESMVQLHILGWPSLDNLNAGAKLARITDAGARFDAMRLGFVTGGNAAGCFCHYWGDAHRLATQVRLHVLLRGGEVGVKVNKESGQIHNTVQENSIMVDGLGQSRITYYCTPLLVGLLGSSFKMP
jgi:hypothetical protein